MDLLDKKVLDSMHILASAVVGKPVDETSLCVDYDKELIEFEFGDCPQKMVVNCGCDSQAASVKDFARQLLMKVEL